MMYILYSPVFCILHVAVDDELLANNKSSSETCRYPKRNIARKNYHESSDEESDPAHFCFCEYSVCHNSCLMLS